MGPADLGRVAAISDLADLRGLRVLAFCDYFPPSSSGGGSERVAFEVYRRLCAAGASVTVVTAVPPGTTVADSSAGALEGIEVVTVVGRDLSRVTGAQVLVATGLRSRARELVGSLRPHVLHANSLHFQTTVAATWTARRTGVPLVTTVHLAGIDLLPAHVRAATGVWERTIGRWVLASSAEVVAVSEAVDDHVRTRTGGDRRVHVVPNGVDLDVFVPGPEEDPPVIAFVGRLIANKGPAVLVAAARTLAEAGRSFQLRVVGDGPQREELEAAVAASPELAERTTFTGFSPVVHQHLAGASILVRPSLTEGMPLAVLEAMAADVCAVVSDIPANGLVVDHDRTGLLFPVGDAPALAAVLASLLDDPERRRALARAGYEMAQGFSWDATAAGTAAVLVDAAGWAPGAP